MPGRSSQWTASDQFQRMGGELASCRRGHDFLGRILDAVGANPRAAELRGMHRGQTIFVTHVTSELFSVLYSFLLFGCARVGNAAMGRNLALNSLAAFMLVFLFNSSLNGAASSSGKKAEIPPE